MVGESHTTRETSCEHTQKRSIVSHRIESCLIPASQGRNGSILTISHIVSLSAASDFGLIAFKGEEERKTQTLSGKFCEEVLGGLS